MTITASVWSVAATTWLCGVFCATGYLLSFASSRRLLETTLRPTITPAELLKPLLCGMLLGMAILLTPPDAASVPPDVSPLHAALFCVGLAGLCAGGWTVWSQAGRRPVSQADLVRRLCVAGNTHEDATARVAVRLALAAGYDRGGASDLMAAASLHDIGTSGIPESILNKTGPLDAREQSLLRRHTWIGHRMLARSHEPMLDLAADIALHHHERWDGGGYPAGLAGERIPLSSRAVALAEAFVELADRSVAGTVEDFLALQQDAGRRFDPRLVALLLADLPGMRAARIGEAVQAGLEAGLARETWPAATWLRPARFHTITRRASS